MLQLIDINTQIEETRDKLNMLILTKEIITDDKELLALSVKLDKLINQYMLTKNSKLTF